MGIFLRSGQTDPWRFFFSVCGNVRGGGLELSDAPCWEMRCCCECLSPSLFVYHGTFSSLINLYLHKKPPGAVIPSFGGAIGFPASKQADLRALPPGSAAALMVTLPAQVFFFFLVGRKTQIFAAITWMKASERRCRPLRAGFLFIQAEIENLNQFM